MDWTAFLLATAIKATVIFAAAFLTTLALMRGSAAARYWVWTAALTTVLALPVLSAWIRPWNVPVAAAAAPVSDWMAPQEAARIHAKQSTSPFSWLLPAWLCGVAAVLLRVGAGHCRLAFLLRRTENIQDPEWTALLEETSAHIGAQRRVALRWSNETDTPLSCGLLCPVVVLPRESEKWTTERGQVVLLHELAHVRRLDPLATLIAQIASAVYWFHPLAWLALSRFYTEQERSCDDAVLIAGTPQSSYAQHLVSLATSLTAAHHRWPATLGMGGTRDFEQRVLAILDPLSKRQAPSRRMLIAALSAVIAVAVPFAALRAQDARPVSALSGSVLDASGAAIPHAAVVLRSTDGKFQERSASGEDGVYAFPRVASGQYTIDVKSPGFAPYQQSGLTLNSGVRERLDVKLDLGAVTDTVEVVGKGPHAAITPAIAGTPGRIRVGGNVQATKLIYSTKPAYPADAETAGIEGTVVLRAVISTQGNLLSVSVMNSFIDPSLAKAATDAVQQWRYQPTLLNGVPVEVTTTIAVNFRLQQP